MRTLRTVLLALLLGSFAGAALAQTSVSAGIHVGPSGRASVDIGFFYDDLAPYGNWIERPSYGWVWTPRSISTGWRPYQAGHWVWTDLGWTWVSDEPYGWATYHYGRWYADPELGWVWVPGDQWGPAWVSWQEGTDYIGWAPLPPSVTVSYGGVLSVSLAPAAYVFVPERYFLAPRITTYVVPQDRVVSVYRETRNITVYRQVNNYVYNTGVPVDRIQRVVGRPVQRYQIADARSAQGTRVQGNQVTIFRPQVQKANVPPPPQRPAARKAVVDAAQFQQRHPERVRSTSGLSGKPATLARTGQQQTGQTPPASEGHPTTQEHPRNRGKGQQEPEMTPPGHQRQVQPPPPGQTEHQHPPKQQQPPQVQEKEKRQEHNPPPPQHPPHQVEPQQHHQQPPPPQLLQKKQQQEKKKEQEERKPPQR